MLFSIVKRLEGHVWCHIRPREIFRGFSALWFLKYLGQFLSALAISGHSERFSPGKIRSEVGCPGGLFKAIGCPTSERISPGENLSRWPKIARTLRNWPKYFENHRAENPRKISRALPFKGPRLASCAASGTKETQGHRHLCCARRRGPRTQSKTADTNLDCAFFESVLFYTPILDDDKSTE